MPPVKTPAISVIMSVFNSDLFLRESLDSILNQTFEDFEFIITEDCSTDCSLSILEKYAEADQRIILVKNEQNAGLTKNLNYMISIAKGKYIARMDADDISLSRRLELQYNYMESNSEIGVLGAGGSIFGSKRKAIILERPETNEEIRAAFFFENLLIHSSVFIRKSVLDQNSIKYDENFRIIQDFELWTRMTGITKFYILPEIFVHYRVSESNISTLTEKKNNYRESILKNIYSNYFLAGGFHFTEEQAETHVIMLHKRKIQNIATLEMIAAWLFYIKNQNEELKFFDNDYFDYMVSKHWFKSCTKSTSLGSGIILKYFRSELRNKFNPGFLDLMRFVLKCIIRY